MIVSHDVEVQGRDNAVQMGLMVRVRYDLEEKVDALLVDAHDQDLFDNVANSLMPDCATAEERRAVRPFRMAHLLDRVAASGSWAGT